MIRIFSRVRTYWSSLVLQPYNLLDKAPAMLARRLLGLYIQLGRNGSLGGEKVEATSYHFRICTVESENFRAKEKASIGF